MKRQKNIISANNVNIADLKPAIDYNGQLINDHFIDGANAEVYKDLKDGRYEVCYKYLNTCNKKIKWKNGYYKVKINGQYYNLHWLIARAFVPGYKVGLCADHKNEDSTDNSITNLQWITRSENTKKNWAHKTKEEREAFKARFAEGVANAHKMGKYKEHLKKLHEKKEG